MNVDNSGNDLIISGENVSIAENLNVLKKVSVNEIYTPSIKIENGGLQITSEKSFTKENLNVDKLPNSPLDGTNFSSEFRSMSVVNSNGAPRDLSNLLKDGTGLLKVDEHDPDSSNNTMKEILYSKGTFIKFSPLLPFNMYGCCIVTDNKDAIQKVQMLGSNNEINWDILNVTSLPNNTQHVINNSDKFGTHSFQLNSLTTNEINNYYGRTTKNDRNG